MDMGGHQNAPVALTSGKRFFTHFTGGWVGPRSHMDMCEKNRPLSGFDFRAVQTLAIRYTDWAVLAQISE